MINFISSIVSAITNMAVEQCPEGHGALIEAVKVIRGTHMKVLKCPDSKCEFYKRLH